MLFPLSTTTSIPINYSVRRLASSLSEASRTSLESFRHQAYFGYVRLPSIFEHILVDYWLYRIRQLEGCQYVYASYRECKSYISIHMARD